MLHTTDRSVQQASVEGGGDASPHNLPSEQGEREGEAPSGFAGGGGDASPYNSNAGGFS